MKLLALYLDYEDNENCGTTILGAFTDLGKLGEFLQGAEDYFNQHTTVNLSIHRLNVNPKSTKSMILAMQPKVQDEDKDIPF
jgi:hypothetical protein